MSVGPGGSLDLDLDFGADPADVDVGQIEADIRAAIEAGEIEPGQSAADATGGGGQTGPGAAEPSGEPVDPTVETPEDAAADTPTQAEEVSGAEPTGQRPGDISVDPGDVAPETEPETAGEMADGVDTGQIERDVGEAVQRGDLDTGEVSESDRQRAIAEAMRESEGPAEPFRPDAPEEGTTVRSVGEGAFAVDLATPTGTETVLVAEAGPGGELVAPFRGSEFERVRDTPAVDRLAGFRQGQVREQAAEQLSEQVPGEVQPEDVRFQDGRAVLAPDRAEEAGEAIAEAVPPAGSIRENRTAANVAAGLAARARAERRAAESLREQLAAETGVQTAGFEAGDEIAVSQTDTGFRADLTPQGRRALTRSVVAAAGGEIADLRFDEEGQVDPEATSAARLADEPLERELQFVLGPPGPRERALGAAGTDAFEMFAGPPGDIERDIGGLVPDRASATAEALGIATSLGLDIVTNIPTVRGAIDAPTETEQDVLEASEDLAQSLQPGVDITAETTGDLAEAAFRTSPAGIGLALLEGEDPIGRAETAIEDVARGPEGDQAGGLIETGAEGITAGVGSVVPFAARSPQFVQGVGETAFDAGLAGLTQNPAESAVAAGAFTEETARQVVTQSVRNPLRTTGLLIGTGGVFAAARRIGPRASVVTRGALQPGEELLGRGGAATFRGAAGAAERVGARRASGALSTSGNVLFPRGEPLFASEEAAIIAAGAVRRRAGRVRRSLAETDITGGLREATGRARGRITSARPTRADVQAFLEGPETTGTDPFVRFERGVNRFFEGEGRLMGPRETVDTMIEQAAPDLLAPARQVQRALDEPTGPTRGPIERVQDIFESDQRTVPADPFVRAEARINQLFEGEGEGVGGGFGELFAPDTPGPIERMNRAFEADTGPGPLERFNQIFESGEQTVPADPFVRAEARISQFFAGEGGPDLLGPAREVRRALDEPTGPGGGPIGRIQDIFEPEQRTVPADPFVRAEAEVSQLFESDTGPGGFSALFAGEGPGPLERISMAFESGGQTVPADPFVRAETRINQLFVGEPGPGPLGRIRRSFEEGETTDFGEAFDTMIEEAAPDFRGGFLERFLFTEPRFRARGEADVVTEAAGPLESRLFVDVEGERARGAIEERVPGQTESADLGPFEGETGPEREPGTGETAGSNVIRTEIERETETGVAIERVRAEAEAEREADARRGFEGVRQREVTGLEAAEAVDPVDGFAATADADVRLRAGQEPLSRPDLETGVGAEVVPRLDPEVRAGIEGRGGLELEAETEAEQELEQELERRRERELEQELEQEVEREQEVEVTDFPEDDELFAEQIPTFGATQRRFESLIADPETIGFGDIGDVGEGDFL